MQQQQKIAHPYLYKCESNSATLLSRPNRYTDFNVIRHEDILILEVGHRLLFAAILYIYLFKFTLLLRVSHLLCLLGLPGEFFRLYQKF